MSQFSTSTQNQVKDKAACLNCGLLTANYPRICDVCLLDSLADSLLAQPKAIRRSVSLSVEVFNSISNLAKLEQRSYESMLRVLIIQALSHRAINFGDDVNTAPTSPTVPVGNTGTTSTGRVL